MSQLLDATQRRVLGVLIEKAKTTPAACPMTVNAVVVGCNQKNNREPLTVLEAFDVEKALSELRDLGAASEIDWLGRAAKYKHQAYEWLGVSKVELAVLAELLLRGEQTLGELRARAARMEPIADLAALKPVVEGLLTRGLMIELTPPGRGQLVSHNLYTTAELAELRARHAGHVPRSESADRDARAGQHSSESAVHGAGQPLAPPRSTELPASAAMSGAVEGLAAELARLQAEVAELRERISDLEAKLAARLG